jgi:hypothetical protein
MGAVADLSVRSDPPGGEREREEERGREREREGEWEGPGGGREREKEKETLPPKKSLIVTKERKKGIQ